MKRLKLSQNIFISWFNLSSIYSVLVSFSCFSGVTWPPYHLASSFLCASLQFSMCFVLISVPGDASHTPDRLLSSSSSSSSSISPSPPCFPQHRCCCTRCALWTPGPVRPPTSAAGRIPQTEEMCGPIAAARSALADTLLFFQECSSATCLKQWDPDKWAALPSKNTKTGWQRAGTAASLLNTFTHKPLTRVKTVWADLEKTRWGHGNIRS